MRAVSTATLRVMLIGLLAGTLSGFLGVGGGILMVPALVLGTTSVVGAVLGARLMARIPERGLQALFGAILVLAAIRLAL